MKKSHYQKLRNERSKRLNNEEVTKTTSTGNIVGLILLVSVLAYLLI